MISLHLEEIVSFPHDIFIKIKVYLHRRAFLESLEAASKSDDFGNLVRQVREARSNPDLIAVRNHAELLLKNAVKKEVETYAALKHAGRKQIQQIVYYAVKECQIDCTMEELFLLLLKAEMQDTPNKDFLKRLMLLAKEHKLPIALKFEQIIDHIYAQEALQRSISTH